MGEQEHLFSRLKRHLLDEALGESRVIQRIRRGVSLTHQKETGHQSGDVHEQQLTVCRPGSKRRWFLLEAL
jgi:hypothetical protein